MKNLAGIKECDVDIRRELEKARIPIVEIEPERTEVPYRLIGRLGGFEFRRAWYYWMVHGLVPIGVAKELYTDPIGVTDIRVAGHCACPPPENPWLKYIGEDGKELIPEEQRGEWERCFKAEAAEMMAKNNLRFSTDREQEGQAYVDSYHIDTQEGLRLFADTLRKYKLV
jgi:hypothetical protein